MPDKEYDPKAMLEYVKQLFTSYELKKQGDYEDKEEECSAICGTYVLNRSVGDTVYCQNFSLAIVLTKGIPHIYLLDDIDAIKKTGFCHFYTTRRCCLGTDVGILISWGDDYEPKSFFENVVDPFLINIISYRTEGKAILGELKHGTAGMEQYYSSLFDISEKEIRRAIIKANMIIISKKITRNEMCICNKRSFKECNCEGKDFLERAIKDKTLRNAFYEDMRSIEWVGARVFRKR